MLNSWSNQPHRQKLSINNHTINLLQHSSTQTKKENSPNFSLKKNSNKPEMKKENNSIQTWHTGSILPTQDLVRQVVGWLPPNHSTSSTDQRISSYKTKLYCLLELDKILAHPLSLIQTHKISCLQIPDPYLNFAKCSCWKME